MKIRKKHNGILLIALVMALLAATSAMAAEYSDDQADLDVLSEENSELQVTNEADSESVVTDIVEGGVLESRMI